jgi:fructokinase
MRKIIGIGETVLDIIFRNEQPIQAVPGGSTFNAIISLSRAGAKTSFISETGNDRIGRMIVKFLKDNGCEATCVNMYPDSKSPLSLAFLNEQNDAEYIFYKDHPHDRLDFSYPDVQPDDIVLFGSYYVLNPVIRPQVKGFLDYAHERGAILYYDVNFRASHQHEVMKLTPNLLENFELADIVRGSSEDFEILFKKSDAEQVYRSQIMFYTKKFICTQAAEPIRCLLIMD